MERASLVTRVLRGILVDYGATHPVGSVTAPKGSAQGQGLVRAVGLPRPDVGAGTEVGGWLHIVGEKKVSKVSRRFPVIPLFFVQEEDRAVARKKTYG